MADPHRDPARRTAVAVAGAPWLSRLSSLVVGIAAVALLGLVVVQGWQVFARYVLNDSPSWTEPVTLLLLATATAMAAAAGVHEDRHFRFNLLAAVLPRPWRRGAEALATLVIATIGAVLAYWGARLLWDGIDIRMAGAPLPQGIVFLPLALGGALMVLFAVGRLLWGAPPVDAPAVDAIDAGGDVA